MKDREWKWPDQWPDLPSGEWDSEPDKVQWRDPATGLPCLIHRSRMGNWCGYVGVSRGHPAYDKDYSDVDVDVHGGLTFDGPCQPHNPNRPEDFGICHVVDPGEDDDVYWLGFDCAHVFDVVPSMLKFEAEMALEHGWPDIPELELKNTYKNIDYVRREVTDLARQLAAMSV